MEVLVALRAKLNPTPNLYLKAMPAIHKTNKFSSSLKVPDWVNITPHSHSQLPNSHIWTLGHYPLVLLFNTPSTLLAYFFNV